MTIIRNLRRLPSRIQRDLSQNRQQVQTFSAKEWVSASKTRNYALKNTLVDWLEYWKKNRSNGSKFGNFLMKMGIKFEEAVIKLIKEKVKPEDFLQICPSYDMFLQNVARYETDTITAIQKGVPFIYQAVLMNRSGDLQYSYGMPDLIVRSDYLRKIINQDPLENGRDYQAPLLSGRYHYVIVDIKFANLNLCANGQTIKNSESVPAFKCQLYIYNHSLGVIQGYEPPSAYILGRGYKYLSRGKSYKFANCFEKLGQIQYTGWDSKYREMAANAISWIRKVRTEGEMWSVLPRPTVPELYPNMTCQTSPPFDKIKLEYAKELGEITLLWNCGMKNREKAHQQGIYSFYDPQCRAHLLGITNRKYRKIIDKMIRVNRDKREKYWEHRKLTTSSLCFTVDFETMPLHEDFTQLPVPQMENYLFLIGIAYRYGETVEYQSFVLEDLTIGSQLKLIKDFYLYLLCITEKYLADSKIPPLYHWGHIERTVLSRLLEKLKKVFPHESSSLEQIKNGLSWFDLSKYFIDEQLVISGCYSYKLKEVAECLHRLGFLQKLWETNDILDGNDAIVFASEYYGGKCKNLTNIQKYNKGDCIVLLDILHILQ